MRYCKHLAEENMQLKPRFEQQREQLREQTAEVRYAEAELRRMKSRVDEIGETRSIDKIASQLAACMRKAEDESEVGFCLHFF